LIVSLRHRILLPPRCRKKLPPHFTRGRSQLISPSARRQGTNARTSSLALRRSRKGGHLPTFLMTAAQPSESNPFSGTDLSQSSKALEDRL
jgi:hypothetical protein